MPQEQASKLTDQDQLWPVAVDALGDWDKAAEQVAKLNAPEIDEVVIDNFIALHENPKLAALTGVESMLVRDGHYNPEGLTQDLSKYFTQSSGAVDAHHVARNRRPVISLEVRGMRRAVMAVLSQMAGRAGQETVIVTRKDDRIELNARPTLGEMQQLAALGVSFFDKKGGSITVPGMKALERAPA